MRCVKERESMTSKPKSSDSLPGTLKPLTRKQQIFVQHLIDHPKASAKSAAQAAYNVTTEKSAEVIASENLRKPEIVAYLENHAQDAKSTLLEVMRYSKEHGKTFSKEGAAYAAVAVNASKDVLDRVYGKAKQQVEINSTAVTLSIDLSGGNQTASSIIEGEETDT
jgi:phage terminase small subunit